MSPSAARPRVRRARPRGRARGFSLAELIVVIVILGILGATVGTFINQPVRAYFETIDRAALADAADFAVRRLARDLQGAVPNSVRIARQGPTVFLEFVPALDAGRYRAAVAASGAPSGADALDFANPADSSFEVFGPPVNAPAGAQLVIMNLGYGDLDLYTGRNRRTLAANGSLQTVRFVPAGAWPADSPTHRFYLVAGAVTYACTPAANGSGVLRRFAGYALQAAQPASTATAPLSSAGSSLVLDDIGACNFTSGTSQADLNAVQVTLRLERNGESVSLYAQVATPNGP